MQPAGGRSSGQARRSQPSLADASFTLLWAIGLGISSFACPVRAAESPDAPSGQLQPDGAGGAVSPHETPTGSDAEPYLAELTQRARNAKLHERPEWLNLLHYRAGLLTGPRSRADGAGFFFDPKGDHDPEAELVATLIAFFAPPVPPPTAEEEIAPPARRHPQCNFPARRAFLDRHLQLDPARLPVQPCPSYELWRQRIDARGLSLVFSDAYLNNPASMYGHTFLRLDKGSPLLSYAINYAADAWTTNGFLFAVLGIFGGFDGFFSTLPYYMKVQEYSNIESRDLWEYSLALTDEELVRVVDHAWELGTTTFDYYFFTENCSFMLLALLDVIRPDLKLTEDFSGWVIPTDTLRSVLRRSGLVTERRWRPSHRSVLIAHRDALADSERDIAERLADSDLEIDEELTLTTTLEPERQARILETAHLLMRWREGYTRSESPEWRAREKSLLNARAALGLRLPPIAMEPILAPPEEGHATARIAAGVGVSERGPNQRLQLRFALHDLLDDETAYQPGSQLEKGDFRLRWDHPVDGSSATPYLERINFIEVLSVTPIERWLFRPAWHARIALNEATDLGCAGWSCLTLEGHVGGGLAFDAGPLSPIYVIAKTRLRALGPLESYGLGGLGGLAGARVTMGRYRLHLESETYFDLLGHETGMKWTTQVGQSVVLSSDFALRLNSLMGNADRWDLGLLVLAYF